MNNICRFTVPASRDMENILDYIADKNSITQAEIFLQQINKKFKRLVFLIWGKKEMNCYHI